MSNSRGAPVRARLAAILSAAILLIAAPALAGGGFSPSVFTFVPVVPDDPQQQAAGWQEAYATLRFVDTRPLIPRIWTCRMKVGMPIRTVIYGRVSPQSAADMTATVATKASGDVMHRQEEWLTIEFCLALIAEMEKTFREDYRGLGARVNGL